MRSREVARRYAEALYGLAAETGAVDEIEQGLHTLVRELEAVPEMMQFLMHPLATREEKTTFVGRAFPDAPAVLRNLLGVVIKNRREGYLDLIYGEYLISRARAERIAAVRVVTARPLDDGERRRISDRLSQALGRAVRVHEVVDEHLIGGVRIEWEGRIVDGTLLARLGRLRGTLGG